MDNHQPFLDCLKQKAEAEGINDRIKPISDDMCALNYPAESFDVIWAEVSILVIGFERGLRK